MTEDDPIEREKARHLRVEQLITEIGDLLHDVVDRVGELTDLDVPPSDWVTTLITELPDTVKAATVAAMGSLGPEVFAAFSGRSEFPMEAVIDRLFADAPKLTDASGKPASEQSPAVECHILLRGSTVDLYGSLSKTPEGALKMLTPAQRQDGPGKPARTVLCEQFFDLSDVMSVMVEREVKATPASSLIVTA